MVVVVVGSSDSSLGTSPLRDNKRIAPFIALSTDKLFSSAFLTISGAFCSKISRTSSRSSCTAHFPFLQFSHLCGGVDWLFNIYQPNQNLPLSTFQNSIHVQYVAHIHDALHLCNEYTVFPEMYQSPAQPSSIEMKAYLV